MNISKSNQKALVKEIKTVVEHMSKVKSAQEKMYFYTAVFGMVHRLMNLEFDPELGFIHNVTQNAYNMINSSIVLIAQGQSMPTLPPDIFDKLQEALLNLADCIANGESTYLALERISTLGYSATGNGYYLFLKGLLKIT